MCRKILSFISLFVVWYLAIADTAFAGQIYYVDASAPGGNGKSWPQAFKYLQDALAVAGSGDEIWVAKGTYKPDQDNAHPGGTGNRSAAFSLKNGVAIYGGFAGNETNAEQRDWVVHETILSGDIGTLGDNTDNSYHVVKGSGTNSTAVLDGFTITSGYADGSNPDDKGAGMFNSSGSPKVMSCTFRNNSAAHWGGGMSNMSGSNPALTNCTFIGNSAGIGGGMFSYYAGGTLTSCMFLGNSGAYGGAVSNEAATLVFVNCIFSGNSATDCGGGMWNNMSSITLTNCTFGGNSASIAGGGMYNINCSPTVTNCVLWGNSDNGGMDESAQIHWIYNAPVVRFSCIQGLSTYAGNNNIGDDPLFQDANGYDDVVGTEDDNLRLNFTSPCIDAGDNDAVPGDTADLDGDGDTTEPTPLDLDRKPRFVDDPGIDDTGNGSPPIVDMGAYEVQLFIPVYEDDIKWSHPPVEVNEGIIDGWDELSDYNNGPIIADDWMCYNDRPIKDIHWWGSFKGWKERIPPEEMPDAFHIGIWTDVPDPEPNNPDTFSHPGKLIWENICDCYVWSFAGYDLDPRGEGENDACFKFGQLLSQDKWFYQEPSSDSDNPIIHWLSIAAIYEGTDDYVVVEDFERYSTRDDIRAVWKDGYTDFRNGSNITLSTEIDSRYGHEPPGPIHEGTNALQFVYDNDGYTCVYVPGEVEYCYWYDYYYSEMEATIDDLQSISNWITEGFKSMSIWFYGDLGNAVGTYEQMYLALEDVDGDVSMVNYEDMNNLKINEWQLWCIDLQDLVDANPNFDLTDVNRIYIGFGERGNNTTPGGSGIVYFDDIGLYRKPLCVCGPNYPWGWKTRPHFYNDDAVRITDINEGAWPPEIGSFWENGEPIEYPEDTSWDMAFVLTTNRKYEPRTCPPIPGDVNGDCIVDWRDYATVANNWLKEILWP